jgi:Right handed beta helix region
MRTLNPVVRLAASLAVFVLSACFQNGVQPAPLTPPSSPTPPQSPPSSPAPPSPPFDGVTLHLNPSATNANDANDGSEAKPLKTIKAAFDKTYPLKDAGQNVRILFYPGTYRDYLVTGSGGEDNEATPRLYWKLAENNAQLVLEAKEPGKAIISGSDVWTGWQDAGGGVWTHAWPYKWGAPKSGQPFGGGPVVRELAARREMVFVNGQRLNQVLAGGNLSPGSFSVDEGASKITLRLETGDDPNRATTEVAVRSRLLYVWNRGHITLRGLVFQHSADRFADGAVAFHIGQGRRCSDVLIEDTVFTQNGSAGLELYCDNTVMRRNRANDNGFSGILGGFFKNLLMEDNQTSQNAWRSFSGGYFGWATAGMKFGLVQGLTVRRHQAIRNQSQGIWVDTGNSDVTVEDSSIVGNAREGLFYEASQGPFVARNNTICKNGVSGVTVAAVAKVQLDGNRIFDNAIGSDQDPNSGNIMFGEVRRKEPANDLNPATEYPLRQITITNNQIAAGPTQLLTNMYFNASSGNADEADYNVFKATYKARGNTWFATEAKPFRFTAPGESYGQRRDWDAYRTLTGQDVDSSFRDPKLTCPN